MPDPTENPAWLQHEGCDQRIAQLEADVTRLREALARVTESGCDDAHEDGCADFYGDEMGSWCEACLAAHDAAAALAEGEPT